LVELFQIGDLLAKPVRQMSLGERMRCEVVASLLHGPQILFLDEPTIGLDVTAKAMLRDLLRAQSVEDGRTLLLTSHDTGDMESVCDRVIVIHRGRLLLDQPTAKLRGGFIGRKRVTVHSAAERLSVELPGVVVAERAPHRTVLDVDLSRAAVEQVVQALLAQTTLQDLSIEDPPMDEIVRAIYARAEPTVPAAGTKEASSCKA
jgi:ABC-2 type transport system ATP-binding protein